MRHVFDFAAPLGPEVLDWVRIPGGAKIRFFLKKCTST